MKAGEEPAGSPTVQLTARLTDSGFSFEAGGQIKSPVADSVMSGTLM